MQRVVFCYRVFPVRHVYITLPSLRIKEMGSMQRVKTKKPNGPVQLIPMPAALLSCLLLTQEIMPKASGDT